MRTLHVWNKSATNCTAWKSPRSWGLEHKFALSFIKQGHQHFQLVRRDSLGEETHGIGDAILHGPQYVQRVAHNVELAFGHLVRVEDEVVWLGAVGEDELRALLLHRTSAVRDQLSLSIVERERQPRAVEAGGSVPSFKGLEGI